MARRISAFAVAGLASIGAGVVHATAAGMHAEHELLTRLFVATAAAQVLIGALVLLRAGRLTAIGTALINGAAVVAWAITRVADISWIGGLEQAEAPQFADTACAALGRDRHRRRTRRPAAGRAHRQERHRHHRASRCRRCGDGRRDARDGEPRPHPR